MARLKNHSAAYWLNDAAAAAFNRMEDEQGFIDLSSAGRTVQEQQEAINRWDRGGAANRPPYLYEPARPASTSNHVKNGGVAFDTGEWRRVAGFAGRYGFSHPYPNSDPVHFEYVGGGSSGGGGGESANVGAGQRTAKAVVNRRTAPSASAGIAGDPLQPGAIGNFTGWKNGDNVEGNSVWYQGISGDWFWSGGFHEGANGSGLKDLNEAAPAPVGGSQRKVNGGSSVNGRTAPNTGASIAQSLDAGTVGDFKAWVEGQSVEGNNVWFIGAYSGNFFWSGGFEGGANTAGLGKADAPGGNATPAPEQPSNASGAKRVTPVYPGAVEGWDSPRGREKREKFGNRPGVQVDAAAIHWTGTLADNLEYFKGAGDGSVPTWYVRPDGSVYEMTRPDLRPVTTAGNNNYTVSFEIQMVAGNKVTQESLEAVAKCLAWVSQQRDINGVPFRFVISRDTVKGHREFPGNSTQCPGDFVMSSLDWLVGRARAIATGETPKPEPTPTPQPEPSTPSDTVAVDRGWLTSVFDKLKAILGK